MKVDYENENVQVPENNNSCDKESDREVSDFLSSEFSCDECFILKQPTRGVLRKRYSTRCSKIHVNEFIFSKVAGVQPATLLKNEFLY